MSYAHMTLEEAARYLLRQIDSVTEQADAFSSTSVKETMLYVSELYGVKALREALEVISAGA